MTLYKCALALAPLAASLAFPAQAAATSIAGNWKTDDGKAIVTFAPCGQTMCGKISRFLVPEPAGGARDNANPDKAKRSRKLLGLTIFWNLKVKGGSYAGKGYSPEEGRDFNAAISRAGNRLKVKGCVLVFCRTVTFTRA
ncbi:DUF2147 domain-containing protein [Altererythrobacter aquiaggeris]|uniref:DUF2147 domain-containing protein n=1 Tax=Aestuarierythrobacter aquiaggeris TaxID=1898396 RepID=UPI003015FC9E